VDVFDKMDNYRNVVLLSAMIHWNGLVFSLKM